MGKSFVIVGGDNDLLPTEKCDLGNDGTLQCVDDGPKLAFYEFYPEIFIAEKSFCSVKQQK